MRSVARCWEPPWHARLWPSSPVVVSHVRSRSLNPHVARPSRSTTNQRNPLSTLVTRSSWSTTQPGEPTVHPRKEGIQPTDRKLRREVDDTACPPGQMRSQRSWVRLHSGNDSLSGYETPTKTSFKKTFLTPWPYSLYWRKTSRKTPSYNTGNITQEEEWLLMFSVFVTQKEIRLNNGI